MDTFRDGFRKLLAWQIAHKLTLDIYRVTKNFPKSEVYGLTSQLQRASSSVAAQLAEGSRMPTTAHRKVYYDRAYDSAAEVDYFLELAHDLFYLSDEDYKRLLQEVNYTSILVYRLSASCRTKK